MTLRGPKVTINWAGPAVEAEITARAARALTEIDLRIVGAAQQELYPGHGVRTGTLRRSLTDAPVRTESRRILGSVGTTIIYALPVHKRYRYFTKAFQKVKAQAPAIIRRHMEQ